MDLSIRIFSCILILELITDNSIQDYLKFLVFETIFNMATCKQNLTLVQLLADFVKCTVCLRQLEPPLIQYSQPVHYVCDVCTGKLKNDPGYQSPENTKRDRVMEQLSFGTILKCSFSTRGCQFTGETVFVVATHEMSCGSVPDVSKRDGGISVGEQSGSTDGDDKNLTELKEDESTTMEGKAEHSWTIVKFAKSRRKPRLGLTLDTESTNVLFPQGKSLEEALLAEMKCPVCLTFIFPPIRECENGHATCNKCFERLKQCSVCRGSKSPLLNNMLEEMYQFIEMPCKNADNGCSVRGKLDSIIGHGDICEFSLESCPLAINGCKWHGLRSEMLDHCKSVHPDDLCLGPQISWSCKYWGSISYKLIYNDGIFFRCGWVPLASFFCFAVTFLGRRTDLRYSFELKMNYYNHGLSGHHVVKAACCQIENDNDIHGFPICWEHFSPVPFSHDCYIDNVLRIFNENAEISSE